MIKKAVIAAAGQGTRMLHLTNNKPKHLINIRRKPFLAYLLDNLLSAGYRELIIVVGYKELMIKDFLRDQKYKALVVNQYEILGEKEYGTACPIKAVKNITAKEHFLYVFGDNLYSVKDLAGMNIGGKYNYIAGLYHPHPEKYGVLISDNGFLKRIVEKPAKNIGNFINAGLYKFTPAIFKKTDIIQKSPRGEYEITDAVTLLAKERKVKIKKLKDYWIDFGNPGDIIKFSNFLKKSDNIVNGDIKNWFR